MLLTTAQTDLSPQVSCLLVPGPQHRLGPPPLLLLAASRHGLGKSVTSQHSLPSRLDDPGFEVVILVTRHADRVTQVVKTLGG